MTILTMNLVVGGGGGGGAVERAGGGGARPDLEPEEKSQELAAIRKKRDLPSIKMFVFRWQSYLVPNCPFLRSGAKLSLNNLIAYIQRLQILCLGGSSSLEELITSHLCHHQVHLFLCHRQARCSVATNSPSTTCFAHNHQKRSQNDANLRENGFRHHYYLVS